MARSYSPFRLGMAERGSDKKCKHCGAAKANQHSLAESAKCDWLKRPKAEREKLLAEQAAREAA